MKSGIDPEGSGTPWRPGTAQDTGRVILGITSVTGPEAWVNRPSPAWRWPSLVLVVVPGAGQVAMDETDEFGVTWFSFDEVVLPSEAGRATGATGQLDVTATPGNVGGSRGADPLGLRLYSGSTRDLVMTSIAARRRRLDHATEPEASRI